MHRVTWEEIMERAGKGYFGDLQIEKPDGSIERGPVTAIRRGESNLIVFDMIWRARKEDRHDEWRSKNSNAIMVSDQCQPNMNQDGTLCFGNSAIGQFKVFQKHTGPLEPHEVYGLEPDEVRKSRAWMYDIPLDSDWKTIVDRVVHDLGADGLVDGHDQVRVQDEAAQFA